MVAVLCMVAAIVDASLLEVRLLISVWTSATLEASTVTAYAMSTEPAPVLLQSVWSS